MKSRTRRFAIGGGLLLAAGSLAFTPSAHAASQLFPLTCGQGIAFDTTNEGWRAQSFMQGATPGKFIDYDAAPWASDDGEPAAGSIEVGDLDDGWMEAVSPVLDGEDHSALNGKTLTFAYKYVTPGQNVSNNVYVALRGDDGKAFYFNFKSQVDSGNDWNAVTIPMEASQWQASFTYNDGPSGSAPSATDFAAVLADLDELAISVEGSDVQSDVTRIDNLQLDCTPTPPAGEFELSCDQGVTFDTSDEGWRAQSFMQGAAPGRITDFGNAPWTDVDGDPSPGSVEVPDQDNGWMEVATPDLAGADKSDLAGTTVTFSYKYVTPGQTVTNNVYVALRGDDGKAVYFPFQDQVDAGNGWATVSVPFDASGWVSSFTYDDGPTATPATAQEFAAVLGNLDEIAISVEGSNVLNDVTRIDNLQVDCGTDPIDPTEPTDPQGPVVPESPLVNAGGEGVLASSSGMGAEIAFGSGLALLAAVALGAARRFRKVR